MNITPLFPSLLLHERIEVPNSLVNTCIMLQNEDTNGVSFSNSGGWQSNPFMHQHDDMKEYIDILSKSINLPTASYFNGLWININYKGSHNKSHQHPQSDYSLVWYVKTPDNCGDIVFENPNLFTQFNSLQRLNYPNYDLDYRITPQVGDCYLFPSDLRHTVEENQSDSDRISISANLVFVDSPQPVHLAAQQGDNPAMITK